MKRLLLIATVFFLGVGTAAADYVLIKININQQLNFVPKLAPPKGPVGGQPIPGGGLRGGVGGAPQPGGAYGGQPQLPGPGGGPDALPNPNKGAAPAAPAEDPNAKWIYAFVEVNNVTPMLNTGNGVIARFDHRWGKNNWMPFMAEKAFPMIKIDMMLPDRFSQAFAASIKKEKNEKKKSVDNFLDLARLALARGRWKEFHQSMEEAEKIDAKHPLVSNYARIKKELQKPFNAEDPAQSELIAKLRSDGYKPYGSERGHFGTYAQVDPKDQPTKDSITRRLAMMEETLESFYYWFALQEKAPQPNLPKYRLNSLLTASDGEFATRHLEWGLMPMVRDGFTPRRDNLVVMSSKARIQDPAYQEFESNLFKSFNEAKAKLQNYNINITRDDLLSGKISENKAAGTGAIYIAAAQTALVLFKTMEEAAERHTITNETTRQLLIASEMFPRNVQVPDWVVEGLAAFFEIPAGAIYPTVGAASWTHLTSFKHFVKNQRISSSSPSDALYSVVKDYNFMDARQVLKEAQDKDNRTNEEAQRANRESWELARCTAWSFVYYLAQSRKLDCLFDYGKELDKLPRDMDLNDFVLEACFAKAFEVSDSPDPRQIHKIKMTNLASNWFEMMQGTNFKNPILQSFYEQERAKQDESAVEKIQPKTNPGSTPTPAIPGSDPNTTPAIPGDPMPPMNPGAKKQGAALAGSTWSGAESRGLLSFQLAAGGQVVMTDRSGNAQGTWTQQGNNITLKFNDGKVTYTGSISGKTMSGTATYGDDNWTWNLTRATGFSNPGAARPPSQTLPRQPAGGRPPGLRPPPRRFP